MKSKNLSAIVVVIGVTFVSAIGLWMWTIRSSAEKAGLEESNEREVSSGTDTVVLNEEKLAAANIQATAAAMKPLHRILTVSGRIQYDDTRHVEVKIPASGILVEIKVKPGDRVQQGSVLAVASSPEIGQARANVIRCEMELALQRERQLHVEEIRTGVMLVTEGIEKGETIEALKHATVNINLEDFHDRLFSNYARLTLARKLVQELNKAAETGAIPTRTATERTAGLESAEATVNGAIELSRHESYLRFRESELATAQAQRQLDLAQQHLRSLLGVDRVGKNVHDTDDTGELALIEVRAPFDGTVERRVYGVSERVTAGDTLFVVADASKLWVSASVREQEWQALELAPGQVITITIPALKSQTRTAIIYYVGREVQALSNAVPIVATIDNPGSDLRPGLFVNVHLPMATPVESLAVPESALLEHEGASFVFVEMGDGKFQRVNVTTGTLQDGVIEIRTGLTAGQSVVTHGAFFLKSELLLEREE